MKIENIKYHLVANHKIAYKLNSEEILNENSVIFDCGAYVGKFTEEIFRLINPNINMFLYEPNIILYKKLVDKFENKENVNIFNKAISNKVGFNNLYLGKNLNESSLKKSKKGLTNDYLNVETTTIPNEIIKLNLKYIDVIKLNVEGEELDIINNLDKGVLEKIGQFAVAFHLNNGIKDYTQEIHDNTIKYMINNGFTSSNYYKNKHKLFFNEKWYNTDKYKELRYG